MIHIELADRLYVFCPNYPKGIGIIIQEIPDKVNGYNSDIILALGVKDASYQHNGKKLVGYKYNNGK